MSQFVTLSEAKGLIRITSVTRVRCFASLSMTAIMMHLTETLHYERSLIRIFIRQSEIGNRQFRPLQWASSTSNPDFAGLSQGMLQCGHVSCDMGRCFPQPGQASVRLSQ